MSSCPKLGAVEVPVPPEEIAKGWDKVNWVMVVVARVDVALTVKPEPVLKVNRPEVAIGLVPLPNKMSLAVMAELPVPPFWTGNIPETSAVKEAWPLYREPPLDLTKPLVKDDNVVEPLDATVK